MADLHTNSRSQSSISTLMIVAIILLSLIYLLAKGCTNSTEGETTGSAHETPAASPHH